jgi:lipopolysaccharide/colanic/teichoic acid biosynthesis glycosyltransferase
MNGTAAATVAAPELPESLSTESAGSMQRSAIVYTWKPAPTFLNSAISRAFSFRYAILKRTIDIVLSLALIVILLPFGLLVALLVALSSPGPVFYREERVGRFRVPFRIIKFRSMYASRVRSKVLDINRAARNGCCASRLNKNVRDPRITPVGRILRRTSLDELPQLWNVLLGDMSLVGPRPIVVAERRFYGRNLPYYDLFCPGITGLWQISGRSDVNYDRRISFDREYASRWSCLLDFVILARTIPAVVTMRGAY